MKKKQKKQDALIQKQMEQLEELDREKRKSVISEVLFSRVFIKFVLLKIF